MEVNTPPPEHISVLGGSIGWEGSSLASNSSRRQQEDNSSQLHRSLCALEHPSVKVPYEVLNRKFRSAQKVVEREVSAMSACVSEVQSALATTPTPAPQQLSHLLKGVITQVSTLKRKAREAVAGELECARVVKRRLEHLQAAGQGTVAERAVWENTRLDRLLTDYLLREGCYLTARKLVGTRHIQNLTNIDIFETAYEVEQSLQQRDVTKCLAWCQENKSKLKKINSNLEVNLRIQEFIEMVKRDERMNAVWHARKYFTSHDVEQLTSIQRCMALLAFPTDTTIPEYQALFSDARWQVLVLEFRAENLRLFQLCPQASLTVVLQAGLSALKTPQCYKSNKESYNPECPVCLPSLNLLAKELPYAHCSQSRLICNISGETMNENNQPLVLPNGYVYGSNALEALAAVNGGNVHCPRTNTHFQFADAQKVFVM